MAWRFKASKYKNAAPIVPKPETCIRDIVVGSYQTYGNSITASAAFMAFNWEHTGSSLAVLPLNDCGRKSKTMPLLHAHSDTVTDMSFSPFHDGLLATGSQDCLVKVWHIPEKGLEAPLSDPECTFSHKQRRVETVGFHPTADCLIHSTSAGNINLWDLTVQKEIFASNDHPEVIQSLSWKLDGTVFATTCKDKMVRILDPRTSNSITNSADSHASIKDSRVVWLGNQNRILTTGFDSARLRQVIIRDLRNFGSPEKTLELDCSTGILLPLYDPDTNMLFLAGKGDTTINYLEVTDKEPYLIEGLRHTGDQTKGACLVPKRALRVMEGEVNRVLQLISNSVIPIMYQVPRKSYRDFHSDLYPETNGYKTDLSAGEWISGINRPLSKMNLDPAKRELGEAPIIIHRGSLTDVVNKFFNLKNCKSPIPTSVTGNVITPTFVPIKDKIKQMEHNNKLIYEQQQQTGQCELEQKFKEIVQVQAVEQPQEDLPVKSELKIDRSDSADSGENNSNSDSLEMNVNGVVPPKPLPRTSRTNSVSDQGTPTTDDTNGGPLNIPRPVAKPRTTSAYKPRLGPKPYSSNNSSADFSFDKVFSVPQVPGSETNGSKHHVEITEAKVEEIELDEKPEDIVIEEKSDSDKVDIETIDPVAPLEPLKNGTNDDHEFVEPRTPSTAERRKLNLTDNDDEENDEEKLFEIRRESDDSFDMVDERDNNFERMTANRNSIAERRRMYENRSQSVIEEKSPTLRRRNSLKSRTEKDEENKKIANATESIRKSNDFNNDLNKKNSTQSLQAPKRTSTVFGRVSKFRHLKGTPGHKSTNIENLRNIGRQLPGECDGFHANFERIAIPLAGQGGKLAVFELSKPGRLPDGVIPSLVNGSNIMDFQFDPFNPKRLIVACDDGIIKIWNIDDGGLTEPINNPTIDFGAHSDKIYFIRFHPLAENVLLTASYDMTMKLWDLDTQTEKICLTGHTDQIFSFAWSPCGKYGATVSKDGKIRIYDPRKSSEPIREGPGPVGSRGARITWAIEGNYIVVTGFDKVSERQIIVYKATDLSTPLNTFGLDVSPAILVPFYDEDSSTLFVTGKGDSTIYAFEITDEPPFICALSHHKCSTAHQGLSFLSKNKCDVSIVEFAKALRLTNNTVEQLSFTVPRIKSELFQDDLFPPTRVSWDATMSASEWFSGKDKKPSFLNLQPEGMECLSQQNSITPSQTPAKKSDLHQQVLQSQNKVGWSADVQGYTKSKQQELQKSVSDRLEINLNLEQDNMEGVDESEWNE